MTSKESVTAASIADALYTAHEEGFSGYEDVLRRMQDDDMLGRDLTFAERGFVRGWFSMPPEVSETERCA